MPKRDGGSGSKSASVSKQKSGISRPQPIRDGSAPTGQDPKTSPASGTVPSGSSGKANQRTGQ